MNQLDYIRNDVLRFILKVNVTYSTALILEIKLNYFRYREIILAVPYHSMEPSFNSTEFRVLLRHMLGLPLYSISRTCPACNKALLDIYGDHSLICGAGSERTHILYNYV